MDWIGWITAGGSIVTAIGVGIASNQLWQSKKQAQTQFEDSMTQQYRAIIHRMPIEVLLGRDVSDQNFDKALDDMYRYFDLCNEQIFLRQQGRICPSTWANWHDGMFSHFKRKAFQRAWKRFEEDTIDHFSELHSLVAQWKEGTGNTDPRRWPQAKAKGTPKKLLF